MVPVPLVHPVNNVLDKFIFLQRKNKVSNKTKPRPAPFLRCFLDVRGGLDVHHLPLRKNSLRETVQSRDVL